MDKKKIEQSLKEIAKSDGVSVEEVRRQIELAISTAMSNPDPTIKAFWDSISSNGKKPTPEEVIAHILRIIGEESKKNDNISRKVSISASETNTNFYINHKNNQNLIRGGF